MEIPCRVVYSTADMDLDAVEQTSNAGTCEPNELFFQPGRLSDVAPDNIDGAPMLNDLVTHA